VEGAEIARRQFGRAEQLHRRADLRDRRRHLVAGSHYVADPQAGHDGEIDAAHRHARRAMQVLEAEPLVADDLHAGCVLTAVHARHRVDGIRLRRE
jgi:hypothetical protein